MGRKLRPAPAAGSPFPAAGKPLFVKRSNAGAAMSANPFLWLISEVIWVYIYIVIAAVIMSWLVGLNVVNARNDFVRAVGNFLYQVTEPALAPIRNRLPNMGGIDFSPMILILALIFLDKFVFWAYLHLFIY
jgi:YggT family protein